MQRDVTDSQIPFRMKFISKDGKQGTHGWVYFPSIVFIIFLFISACSSTPKNQEIEFSPLASDLLSPSNAALETIVLLGTNDLHGTLLPQKLKTREMPGIKAVEYEAGGVSILSSFIEILRSQYGSRFIWLDAGDEYHGALESNLDQGATMIRFLSLRGLRAAAIGNHEFDFGAVRNRPEDLLGVLKLRMSEARFPYVASNVVSRKMERLPDFPNAVPRLLFRAGRLNVGVIGLSTRDTPRTTRASHVKSLAFTSLRDATIREAAALRREGADLILVTAHVGLTCKQGKALAGYAIRKPSDPQGECDRRDELTELLRSLPQGTVDAVVAGHSHQIVHHWVAGVPVIQGGVFGKYFNIIYLTYDMQGRKILPQMSRIEGPVPVCKEIFRNQNDCNGSKPSPRDGRGPLVPARFHGERIRPDPEIDRLILPAARRAAEESARIIGRAARPVGHERFAESALGNLVSDSFRYVAKTDIGFVNSGGIRSSLEEGPITFGEVFRALPFDNSISVLKLTGNQLKLLVRIAESGSRGFPSFSGLRIKLIDPSLDAPSSDLNGNGRVEPWEINRVIDVRLETGEKIREKKIYTVATIDFLTQGGDDLDWFMSRIQADQIQSDIGVLMRDAVVQWIVQEETQGREINSPDRPLVDLNHRRLEFVRTKKRGWASWVRQTEMTCLAPILLF